MKKIALLACVALMGLSAMGQTFQKVSIKQKLFNFNFNL